MLVAISIIVIVGNVLLFSRPGWGNIHNMQKYGGARQMDTHTHPRTHPHTHTQTYLCNIRLVIELNHEATIRPHIKPLKQI